MNGILVCVCVFVSTLVFDEGGFCYTTNHHLRSQWIEVKAGKFVIDDVNQTERMK